MKNIEIFYSNFSNEQRILIDKLSGSIFEIFPIVKEKIKFKFLEYIDSEYGKFLVLNVKEVSVELIVKKKNKILGNFEFFYEEEIDKNKLEIEIKKILSEYF